MSIVVCLAKGGWDGQHQWSWGGNIGQSRHHFHSTPQLHAYMDVVGQSQIPRDNQLKVVRWNVVLIHGLVVSSSFHCAL